MERHKAKHKKTFLFAALLMPGSLLFAQGGSAPAKSSLSDPVVLVMVIIMLILLLAIALLANVVIGAAHYYRQNQKEREKNSAAATTPGILTMAGLLLLVNGAFAQNTAKGTSLQVASGFGSLSATAFYTLVSVLMAELVVIFYLLYQLKVFVKKERIAAGDPAYAKTKNSTLQYLWDKLNSFRPQEQEANIDLGHEYDGIRELDNRLPPWWIYGFYVTIVIGAIYLWRYHVSHTAPSSHEEFSIAMQKAAAEKEAYLKRTASNVDENTVKLSTEASVLATGKSVYELNCAACHGKEGGGTVGPNLTDDYWLHGGSVSDIFKSIKYGWPEKGMRSWKEDLSPMQISQLSSYIKSLHGTNPPNPKEKQGELFQEAKTGDSTLVASH